MVVSWLHHANVDRLFALWQSIYYNQYLTQMPEGQGTFTIPPGTQDTMNTLLEPFSSNGRGQFYTSSTAWKMNTFGYTYPEIQDWNQTPSQLQSNVIAAVNKMYNPQSTPTKRAATPGGLAKEWSVGLSVSKYDLEGERFIIRVFLGAVQRTGLSATDVWVRSLCFLHHTLALVPIPLSLPMMKLI